MLTTWSMCCWASLWCLSAAMDCGNGRSHTHERNCTDVCGHLSSGPRGTAPDELCGAGRTLSQREAAKLHLGSQRRHARRNAGVATPAHWSNRVVAACVWCVAGVSVGGQIVSGNERRGYRDQSRELFWKAKVVSVQDAVREFVFGW